MYGSWIMSSFNFITHSTSRVWMFPPFLAPVGVCVERALPELLQNLLTSSLRNIAGEVIECMELDSSLCYKNFFFALKLRVCKV